MNLRTIARCVASLLFAAGMSACGDDETTAQGSAALSGDMGRVTGFATQQASLSLNDTANRVRIDAQGDGVDGWAMTALTFDRPLSDPSWAPGTTYDSSSANDHYVGGLGCSGPSYERWDFDRSANHIHVRVDAGPTPSDRAITFEMQWNTTSNGPQAVVGSFVYHVPN